MQLYGPDGNRIKFGYNATVDKGRRQAPTTRVKHESDILKVRDRTKLQATAQDQLRNHSILAWMVRKHLDYISQFHVQIRSGRTKTDALLNRIFKWHGAPRNFDVAGRFGRNEMMRMFEMEKVVNGDSAMIKLEGLKLQAMESDRIRKGDYDGDVDVTDSGLVVDDYGRVLQYCLCDRTGNTGQYTFNHLEDADNVIFDGYWTRFGSQWRGVSPLSTALNTMQDINEAFEWNLIKAKMHALFGVAILRKTDGNPELGGASGVDAETDSESAASDDSHLDLDPRTVNLLDLNPDEDVRTIESGTPSSEFVEGSYLFIQTALLALDIPITCFDSRRSSFSARIADLNEYEVSARHKQTKNRYVLQDYSDWTIDEIWNDAESSWPLRQVAVADGLNKRDVQEIVNWVPHGSPWMDKLKQVTGDKMAISLGLDNAIDAARRRGSDVFANIDKQAEVIRYANDKGVPIATNAASDDTNMDLILAEESTQ
jgi:capsid protein